MLFSLGPLKSGAVSIGGKDLAGISCHTVRSNLAIVPQSPTLFDGVSTPYSVLFIAYLKQFDPKEMTLSAAVIRHCAREPLGW